MKNGKYFEGNFVYEKFHGKGTMWTKDKSMKYEGGWNQNSLRGKGLITTNEGIQVRVDIIKWPEFKILEEGITEDETTKYSEWVKMF